MCLLRRPPCRRAPPPPTDLPTSTLRLHQAMVVLGAAAQVVLTARSWHETDLAGRASTTWLSLHVALAAAGMLAWPAFYRRNHRWMMPLGRALVHTAPSWRRTRVGAALMLEQHARPGWAGAATDAVRTLAGEKAGRPACRTLAAAAAAAGAPLGVPSARRLCPASTGVALVAPGSPCPLLPPPARPTGTRTLTLIVGGLAIPQEPILTAVTQTLLLASVRSSGAHGYCGVTALLTDATSRRRAALLGEALDWGSLPVAFLVPAVAAAPRHAGLQGACAACSCMLPLPACALARAGQARLRLQKHCRVPAPSAPCPAPAALPPPAQAPPSLVTCVRRSCCLCSCCWACCCPLWSQQ